MNILKSINLCYEYVRYNDNGGVKALKALDNVNISVEKGSFIAILGHNGSGKSTFAKHINALLTPSSGSLFIKGYDTKNEDFLWDIRQSVGMVFQNPDNQIIATIVEEDIAFGPENLGVDPLEIRQRVDKCLEVVGMSEYRNHSTNSLSGGQKQRISIAGILAMQPECIVFDEPTAMLDPEGRREVIDTVRQLNIQNGITVILITHFMDEAIYADKVFVMEDSCVVMEGAPNEIFVQVQKLKEFGLDVPQVTEVAYNLKKAGFDISSYVFTIEELVGELCQYNLKI